MKEIGCLIRKNQLSTTIPSALWDILSALEACSVQASTGRWAFAPQAQQHRTHMLVAFSLLATQRVGLRALRNVIIASFNVQLSLCDCKGSWEKLLGKEA